MSLSMNAALEVLKENKRESLTSSYTYEALDVAIKLMEYEVKVEASIKWDLSKRELQTVRLVSRGLNNTEIAYEMALSQRTVVNHLRSVFLKLNITNRTEAAILYLREAAKCQ